MGSFLWLQNGLAVAGKQVSHKMQSGKIRYNHMLPEIKTKRPND
jgi:hypothetical protein